ncbi:MAG: hypothetical protein OXF95_03770 [Rhodobacteraceae bacterium]|nr:hypothetical protein [Paracoccaceae bacterium]
MTFEPLKIGDETFLIHRMIEQTPTSTLIREFFKNAEESASSAQENNKRIEIYPVEINGVRKLAFWNTGIGMDELELKCATNLSSSINKDLALDGNYGIGAKVSGLTISKTGIRYRSCKNGRVHQVTIGYDDEEQTYGRFADQLSDGSFQTVYEVTDVVVNEGKETKFDWTEVVLYGESDDHDTVSEPMGKNKKKDRSFIPTSIFRRFAEISNGVDVKIDVAMTGGGGKNETGRFRRLKTLNEVVNEIGLMNESVKDDGTGISVNYIHDPKHENYSHTLSSRANAATGSTTFCAVIHKGERYDFKTRKAWSAAAPNFGIPFGSKVLTVEISIPDDFAYPTQYRDGLTWQEDRSPMVADDFSDWVRELMPEWVKEIIRAESPQSNDNLDDLEEELQKLLDKFRVKIDTRTFANKPDYTSSEDHAEGIDSTEQTKIFEEEFLYEHSKVPKEEGVSGGMKRAKNRKIRKAPEGAKASISSKALERVPEIKILLDEEKIAEKEINGRAGRFYKEIQTIFVNGLYSASYRMAEELELELIGESDPEQVREIALKTSRRFMAFRVGKTVCYAISKKLMDDWNTDDLEKATSPESLSMSADDYNQHLSKAKKWAKDQIKLNLVKRAA